MSHGRGGVLSVPVRRDWVQYASPSMQLEVQHPSKTPRELERHGCDTPCNTISKRCCTIWGGVSQTSRKSRWGLSNGAQGHSLQFAHNRPQLCTFVAFLGGPFLRGIFVNRGKLWTIMDKYPEPPLAKPPFRLSRKLGR